MEARSWTNVKEILQEILELDAADRRVKLAALPNDLREEIESLLAFERAAVSWDPLSAIELSRDVLGALESEPAPTLPGQRFGIYEIVRELGGGGMGTVYEARRSDGKFEQKVALKALRREINNESIRNFFKRESEIQAKLEHPYIARLLDVGTTEDGIPFFAMEYVEGEPIDEFCERNNLSLKARLKLFAKVCQAVSHAHQNLIIHRDLKPSNIFVNQEGEPKLLDFGISKLLSSDESEDNLSITALGAMTPEYASPEQIKGETISTATDIYSLGVILYKLLAGSLPFTLSGKNKGNLLWIVTKNEPVPPSMERNNHAGRGMGQITSNSLKGDLDNIILKSLRKEPELRYGTVEQFSADIWRYLDGVPVRARPATFFYRTAKFFGRNKLSVTAAAVIIISLIGGTGVALWQARTARLAQAQAEERSSYARSQEEKAKKVSRFMFRIFSYANPGWYAEGKESRGQARVIDAMEALAGKIDTEFAGEADIQAELHYQFAEVYGRVASDSRKQNEPMREKSYFHICRALDLRKQYYGEWHELVAKDLYFGTGCVANTPAGAAATLKKAIDMMRDTNPNNINFPYMLNDYAGGLTFPPADEGLHNLYFQAAGPTDSANKFELAEKYFREALPVFRQHYRPDNLPIFLAECRLSYLLAVQDKWDDFDTHFAVCRQGEGEVKDYFTGTTNQPPIDLVRQVLAEKGIDK